MTAKQFVLKSVRPLEDRRLALQYADDAAFQVDVAPIIERHRSLHRLRNDDLFASARLGDFGLSVAWGDDDDLELASDNLRARAIEQTGQVSHEFILNWMDKHSMSLDDAARALGLSRRMIAYYRSGEKPVPRSVALACIGFDQALKSDDLQFALMV